MPLVFRCSFQHAAAAAAAAAHARAARSAHGSVPSAA
jgi:hypothetical protein